MKIDKKNLFPLSLSYRLDEPIRIELSKIFRCISKDFGGQQRFSIK